MQILFLFLTVLLTSAAAGSKESELLESQLKKNLSEGFLDARIENNQLIKGNIYKIGQVKVNQPAALPAISFATFTGKPAALATTEKIIAELKEMLLGTGFIFSSIEFEIEPATSVSPDKISSRKVTGKPSTKSTDKSFARSTVNLIINVETGAQFKLGKLVFKGTKTREKTLQRMSLLERGETYDYRRIQRAIEKLSRSGYFASVYQEVLTRDSVKHLVYPILNLSDLKANNISGILGYNNEDNREGSGVNGFIDINLVNLLGTARDLEFHFAAQNRERQINFVYTEPWILTLPVGASFNLSHLMEDSLYVETSYGTTLFQDINFNSRYNLSFLRQFNETFFFKDSFTGFVDTLIFTSSKSTAFISGIELIQDWRNKVPSTFSGGLMKTRFNGIKRNEDSRDTYLMQNLSESHFWFPLGKRFILKTKTAAAVSLPLKTSLENRGNLFQLGGTNSIRGYREKEFLTDAYVYNNIELHYLLSVRNRILLLADPGLVNKPVGDFYWNQVFGYGFGFDLGSREWVFAIRYALSRQRSFSNGLLHVKIENRF